MRFFLVLSTTPHLAFRPRLSEEHTGWLGGSGTAAWGDGEVPLSHHPKGEEDGKNGGRKGIDSFCPEDSFGSLQGEVCMHFYATNPLALNPLTYSTPWCCESRAAGLKDDRNIQPAIPVLTCHGIRRRRAFISTFSEDATRGVRRRSAGRFPT